ncbi:sugar transferase [Salibacterium salarium]|uniref:Sugar transferase n=1 Tax=Salibacterium salarium TaxID=284579 RepID=A0A3R9QGF9_9BACI|nr:sugar transferase [Salibacterium salarium]RSL29995.1 sugar transferase [Salibacterium salarium]
MNRLFDIIIASSAIVVLGVVMLLTAVVIRLKMGSPVLFKHIRPGLHEKPFVMYKFRTMAEERNEAGELLTDEGRLSPLGRFLRKSSLDELPQLINVLKGDLSIVGPRPLYRSYLSLYSPYQARRHEVKPGITGWAQVNGRNDVSWEKRFELDVWYVDNRSLFLDMKIIGMTIKKVMNTEGVNQPGHATMPDFKGNKERD